ncbi:MAG TPA: serine/threonine-protein kinase, partial [Gemmatimonadaceae bacterium]|nr:serine/threonine-protein kinase [Gemmatimonadaceae bacterium]
LRDVARALAYAHAHGVVHRDIKPENVLMSGGSAAVADFGIAKALAAAGKERDTGAPAGVVAPSGGLTQIGMSIGTPIYMAPEQAAADPSADHRADIYSFGCLAYELLTGRPPFTGLAPHRLLVAHMTERPRPVAELRPDAPRALSDLVMRCLEKDPDRRPQTAAEIARELDAVTSSPTIESVRVPAPLAPTLLKMLAAYAIALVAVAQIARIAIVDIGLPGWVMPSSIMLLAVGFPIIAATSHYRRFTWRRSAALGVAGLVAFVVVVGGFMRMREAGIGPFGTLLGAGKLNRRDKVLVADFTSTGADTTLGSVVSEAVRADLGQSPIVSVVTPQTVATTLELMQRPDNTRIDATVARQVAIRDGVKAIVDGDVHAIAGGGFVVSMQLVSADSGQQLASLQASADDAKDLIPTIGRLTRRLRSKMGESLKHLEASAELAQVTTSSLPALEAYSKGQHAMAVEGNLSKAIPLFRQAIALDTGFASAYRALGVALANRNQDRDERIRALEKAYAHSDRLPEIERYLAIATYWTQGPKPDDAKAMAAYDTLLSIHPNNYAALNNSALIYARRRDFTQAAALARRSIAANPTSLTAYDNLIADDAELGLHASVDSTFAAELKASGDNPRVAMRRAQLLYGRGEYDSTLAIVDSVASANRGEADLTQMRVGLEQVVALTRGKLAEGLKLASQNAEMSASNGSPTARLNASFDSALVAAIFLGAKDRALALV